MNAENVKHQFCDAISESFHLTSPSGPVVKIRAAISAASATLDMDDLRQAKLFTALNDAHDSLRRLESVADVLQTKICEVTLQMRDAGSEDSTGVSSAI